MKLYDMIKMINRPLFSKTFLLIVPYQKRTFESSNHISFEVNKMKKQWTLPAIILVEIGIYFTLMQYNIVLFQGMYSWKAILILFGMALFIQAIIEKKPTNILPSTILIGIGIHFLWGKSISFWPDDLIAILFILSVGIILQAFRTKGEFFPGIILLLIGLFLYFLPSIIAFFQVFERMIGYAEKFWPLSFIILGFYLLFARKK